MANLYFFQKKDSKSGTEHKAKKLSIKKLYE